MEKHLSSLARFLPQANAFLFRPCQQTSRDVDSSSGVSSSRATLDKEPVQEGNVFPTAKDGRDAIRHSEFIKKTSAIEENKWYGG